MNSQLQSAFPTLTHGDHCCLLYDTPYEQRDATLPFLKLGLQRDERCVYVASPAAVERMQRALEDAGVNVEREAKRKRLILTSAQDYLDNSRFSPEKMLGFLQEAYDSAITDGFTALRATGDVAWQVGPHQNFSDVVYYEAMLDLFFLGKRMVGMCQYDKSKCPAEVLSGIMNTHKTAVLDQALYPDNVHYVPPELLLEKDEQVRREKRIEWMGSQLARLKRVEESKRVVIEQLLREKRELERVNLELDSFIYIASHDLKSPLRALVSLAGIVQTDYAEKLDEKGRNYLEEIGKCSHRMHNLVDDLLTLSRSARLESVYENVSSAALVKDALERNKHMKLESHLLHVASDLPDIFCDRIKMTEVFVNLINNALKFSGRAKNPEVSVEWEEKPETVQFRVTDNGIGIEPEYLKKVFDMFKRLNQVDEYEGTGIGLYIVKKIVELHKGKVWVESSPGKRTAFMFELPKTLPLKTPE